MKQKLFTRPVSLLLSDEMFVQIKMITDSGQISISDYIRMAIQEKMTEEKEN